MNFCWRLVNCCIFNVIFMHSLQCIWVFWCISPAKTAEPSVCRLECSLLGPRNHIGLHVFDGGPDLSRMFPFLKSRTYLDVPRRQYTQRDSQGGSTLQCGLLTTVIVWTCASRVRQKLTTVGNQITNMRKDKNTNPKYQMSLSQMYTRDALPRFSFSVFLFLVLGSVRYRLSWLVSAFNLAHVKIASRIVSILYRVTDMDAQCDKLAKVVGRTLAIIITVNAHLWVRTTCFSNGRARWQIFYVHSSRQIQRLVAYFGDISL